VTRTTVSVALHGEHPNPAGDRGRRTRLGVGGVHSREVTN
jgi:hypothetical protein